MTEKDTYTANTHTHACTHSADKRRDKTQSQRWMLSPGLSDVDGVCEHTLLVLFQGGREELSPGRVSRTGGGGWLPDVSHGRAEGTECVAATNLSVTHTKRAAEVGPPLQAIPICQSHTQKEQLRLGLHCRLSLLLIWPAEAAVTLQMMLPCQSHQRPVTLQKTLTWQSCQSRCHCTPPTQLHCHKRSPVGHTKFQSYIPAKGHLSVTPNFCHIDTPAKGHLLVTPNSSHIPQQKVTHTKFQSHNIHSNKRQVITKS